MEWQLLFNLLFICAIVYLLSDASALWRVFMEMLVREGNNVKSVIDNFECVVSDVSRMKRDILELKDTIKKLEAGKKTVE